MHLNNLTPEVQKTGEIPRFWKRQNPLLDPELVEKKAGALRQPITTGGGISETALQQEMRATRGREAPSSVQPRFQRPNSGQQDAMVGMASGTPPGGVHQGGCQVGGTCSDTMFK